MIKMLKNKNIAILLIIICSVLPIKVQPQAVHVPGSPFEVGFGKIFSVKNYNAKGDGTTDDTTAIQNCINAAAASTPAFVYIPAGTYRITSNLTVTTANVGVFGDGAYNTIIRQDTWGNATILIEANYCQVSGIGFRSANTATCTLSGTTMTLTSGTCAGFGITNGMTIWADVNGLAEAVTASSVGTNSFTATPIYGSFLLAHTGTFPITVKTALGGSFLGMAGRNECSGIYIADTGNGANYCSIKDCVSWGLVSLVTSRGNTSSNTLEITSLSVKNCDIYGYEFGIVLRQTREYLVDTIRSYSATLSQGNNPSHFLYATGTNPGLTGQRNINGSIANCLSVNNIYGAALEVKFTDGFTVSGIVADYCERGVSVEGCYGGTITNCMARNTPQRLSYDSLQYMFQIQDSRDITVTNCVANLLDTTDAVATTDTTTNTAASGSSTGATVSSTFTPASMTGISAGQCAWIDWAASTGEYADITAAPGPTFTASTRNAHSGAVSTTSSSTITAGATSLTVASATGIQLYAFYNIDTGANAEQIEVTSVAGNVITITPTSNNHDGSVTPFAFSSATIQIKVFPFSDNGTTIVGGFAVRSLDSQNGNGQTCTNVNFINCSVIAAYSDNAQGGVFRLEGTRTQCIGCSIHNYGGINQNASGTWQAFRVISSTTGFNPDGNIIIDPIVWGSFGVLNSASSVTNGVYQFDLDRISTGPNAASFANSNTSSNNHVSVRETAYANISSSGFQSLSTNNVAPSVSGRRNVKTNNNVSVTASSGGSQTVINTSSTSNVVAGAVIICKTGTAGNIGKQSIVVSFVSNSSITVSPPFPSSTSNNDTFSISTIYTSLGNGVRGQTTTLSCYDGGSAINGQYTSMLPGSQLTINGPWYPSSYDTITLYYDGSSWKEISRTGGFGWTNFTGDLFSVSGNYVYCRCDNSGAQNLTNIAGGKEGSVVVLTATNSNTTVVYNAGKIALTGGSNYALSPTKTLTLVLHEGVWVETSRGGN